VVSAGLPDDPWGDDRTAHERHPIQYMRRTKDRRQSLAGIDAVLQRDQDRFTADQGTNMISRGFDVTELHAEQHQIDGAERGGIVAP
jgi:hypothetical protein